MKERVTIQKLKRNKQKLLKTMTIPVHGLPGSLSVTNLRCGKKLCHCMGEGKAHEAWSLTFMSEGKKRVLHIPRELVEEVRQRVEEGKNFREEINQVFAANAELLVLLRKQGRK